MAVTEIALPAGSWTKIGDNVSDMTFQNAGQWPIYINFTSADSAPADTVGFIYNTYEEEIKKTLTELTYVTTPTYVWAKPVSGRDGKVIVETA